jgi:ABC-type transport system involved in Fe-S cluster assembly fused permease/ATPase subunit
MNSVEGVGGSRASQEPCASITAFQIGTWASSSTLTLQKQKHTHTHTHTSTPLTLRGTRGIGFILGAAVFNVVPTFLEVAAVTAILTYTCGPALGGLTLATLGGRFGMCCGVGGSNLRSTVAFLS